jgi:hypothetical protein
MQFRVFEGLRWNAKFDATADEKCQIKCVLFNVITVVSIPFQFDDILDFGWQEVNQGTRNIIQKSVIKFKRAYCLHFLKVELINRF